MTSHEFLNWPWFVPFWSLFYFLGYIIIGDQLYTKKCFQKVFQKYSQKPNSWKIAKLNFSKTIALVIDIVDIYQAGILGSAITTSLLTFFFFQRPTWFAQGRKQLQDRLHDVPPLLLPKHPEVRGKEKYSLGKCLVGLKPLSGSYQTGAKCHAIYIYI